MSKTYELTKDELFILIDAYTFELAATSAGLRSSDRINLKEFVEQWLKEHGKEDGNE